jgi:outer membrane protein assembly factor BamE (lipoprotein component of BamABCDE complex)
MMKIRLQHAGVRSVIFALLLSGAALAQAAKGFTVDAKQQAAVKVGMTRDEVRGLLGRPAHNLKYRSEPGRTWTYGVVTTDVAGQENVFDVDFSADGRVLSTDKRVEQMQ